MKVAIFGEQVCRKLYSFRANKNNYSVTALVRKEVKTN